MRKAAQQRSQSAACNDAAVLLHVHQRDAIAAMAELARLHGIKVVLASTLPLNDSFGKIWTERTPTGKLIGLNNWMREYCTKNGHVFLDFYGPLRGGKAWTDDGLRPNAAGYAVMKPLAEKAIADALSRR